MWTALDWDFLKPWGCCFVEDVVTLQVSLLFTEGGCGGWGGCNNVMWSALDWELLKPWGCSFVEAVVTATAPWEDQWCSRAKQLLQKAYVDVKMKKVWCSFRPWFSSQLWHFLVVNRTTKNAWNRNSNGFDVAHTLGHPWKMQIYNFSARTNVKFIRADIATFTGRTIWEKSIKHWKSNFRQYGQMKSKDGKGQREEKD